MTESDLQRFGDWFETLAVIHRLAGSEDARLRMKAEYFDVLRPYAVIAVESAYQTLRHRMKKWPVPADWLEALPPHGSATRLPLLTFEEQRENDEAERLGYEAEKYCHCRECEAADATHIKPRYVPRLDQHGHTIDRQHSTRPNRAVSLGRWIHGTELKGYYAAMGAFFALRAKLEAKAGLPVLTPEERIERMKREAKALQAEATAPIDADSAW
jgi:hypothetical protein